MSVPPRPAMTRDLLELLRTRYGLDWVGNPVELPSSVNLNVLLSTPDGGCLLYTSDAADECVNG